MLRNLRVSTLFREGETRFRHLARTPARSSKSHSWKEITKRPATGIWTCYPAQKGMRTRLFLWSALTRLTVIAVPSALVAVLYFWGGAFASLFDWIQTFGLALWETLAILAILATLVLIVIGTFLRRIWPLVTKFQRETLKRKEGKFFVRVCFKRDQTHERKEHMEATVEFISEKL